MRLKIVFMGTPQFAVPSLERLISSDFDVVGVITSPDRMGGRGRKVLLESPVKKCAEKHNLKILQPTNLKKESFTKELASLNADIQIVVAFRMLPEVVWNMPPLGTYNLHGSLLPKYRGAAPINWAIINGESITGVTFFKLKHAIDTGDMLLNETIEIDIADNAGTIHDKMMILASEVVYKGVTLISQGKLEFIPQDDKSATKAPKIFKETCEIDFTQPAWKVYNFVRGMSPYPGAWCKIAGIDFKILEARYYADGLERKPGQIFSNNKDYMTITCTDGYLHVQKLQIPGKKVMDLSTFLNGYDLVADQID